MGPEATFETYMPLWSKEMGKGTQDFKGKQAIHRQMRERKHLVNKFLPDHIETMGDRRVSNKQTCLVSPCLPQIRIMMLR